MSGGMNPFPGAQPYRAADRARFFGRDPLVKKLANQILARPVTSLFGPSGAGKSSLMQAGVIPRLAETHDYRVVRVDAWPPGEAPLPWLVRAIFVDLDLGAAPADRGAPGALDEAMRAAERRSEQPILIYLDQIEQLLSPERDEREVDALIEAMDKLARVPGQDLSIVIALREDYLGRFRDRARDRKELLAHGFRLGPLTVSEMVSAVCKAAAEGDPPQRWDEAQIRGLMLEMVPAGQRASDAAEVQAAYAQIVCRALFQQRAEGKAEGAIEAEAILRRYLDETLDDLGSEARCLLEDHLVTGDGSRTLRTEKELSRILPEAKLSPILKALEGAAILHAEAHEGSRYFEIGHDWLAKKVHEQRQIREREEDERRRRAEEDAERAKERARIRFYFIVAIVSIGVAAGAGFLGLLAWKSQKRAEVASELASAKQAEAEASSRLAKAKQIEADNARLLAGFRELKASKRLAIATKLLLAVSEPEAARGWTSLASDALASTALFLTLDGHRQPITLAAWSHDGKKVLTASTDGTARIWSAERRGDPRVLKGHEGSITAADWSPDDRWVITASADETARIWSVDAGGEPRVLAGHKGALTAAAFNPDGDRVLTASKDGTARVWRTDGEGDPLPLKGHEKGITAAAWIPSDGKRVITASEDGTARIWSADGAGQPVVLRGPKGALTSLAVSPDGRRVVTTSSHDKIARIWDLSSNSKAVELIGHTDAVLHAAWSADGKRVATASADRTARVWSDDGKSSVVLSPGHTQAVTRVAFRRDGKYVATASVDESVLVWPAEGGTPLKLREHTGPVRSLAWSPDGSRLLSAAGEGERERSPDLTARIWHPTQLDALARSPHPFFHAASFGAGGDLVVSAYDNGTVHLWRADGTGDPVVIQIPGDWVTSAAMSADQKRIATASLDGVARVWDASGQGNPVSLPGHTRAVRAAAFSPQGDRIVTASDDGTALIHRMDGQDKPIPLSAHKDALTSVAWSGDGARIVTTSLDHTAIVWRADGSGAKVVLGHQAPVNAAAFRGDSKRVVTASDDGIAQVWDADTGLPAAPPLKHDSAVLRAIWSPDGARIATSSLATSTQKAKLRVWSADGRGEPVELDTQSPIIAMAFLEDGRRIRAIAADNTVRDWTLDVAALREGLKKSNLDCLSAEMREIHLGEDKDVATKRHAACTRGEVDVDLDPQVSAAPRAPSSDVTPWDPNQWLTPRAEPKALEAGQIRVLLRVLPGDASVEVEKKPSRRRDGLIEIVGPVGKEYNVQASKGSSKPKPEKITLQETGAVPPFIDVFAAPKPGARDPDEQKPVRFDNPNE